MGNPINVPAEAAYSVPFGVPTSFTGGPALALLVATGALRLLLFTITNNAAASRYIQLFDQATTTLHVGDSAKTTGALVASGASYSFTTRELGPDGIGFRTGLVVGSSITPTLWTPGGASDLTVTACWTCSTP